MNEFINIFSSSDPENVSSTVKLLLLLTVFSVALNIDSYDLLYSHRHRSVICQNFTCDAIYAPKPRFLSGLRCF